MQSLFPIWGLFTRQYTSYVEFLSVVKEEGAPEQFALLKPADRVFHRKTFKEKDLTVVRENARVIFSTYGMGKDAVDIPRLDAGIDATPRADGTQAIGRIRRPMVGKKRPVWFTIRDLGIPPLVGYTQARLNDYRKSGVTVFDTNH